MAMAGSQPAAEPGNSDPGLNVLPPSVDLAKPIPPQPIHSSYKMPVFWSIAVSTSAFCSGHAAPALTLTAGPTTGAVDQTGGVPDCGAGASIRPATANAPNTGDRRPIRVGRICRSSVSGPLNGPTQEYNSDGERYLLILASRIGTGTGDPASSHHVLAHLLDQLADRPELDLAANPISELDGYVHPVQVEIIPVQRVRLDGLVGPVEGWVGADRDRRRPPFRLGAVG